SMTASRSASATTQEPSASARGLARRQRQDHAFRFACAPTALGHARETLEPPLVPLEETAAQDGPAQAHDEPLLRLLGDDVAPAVARLEHPAVVRRRSEPLAAPRQALVRDQLRDRRVRADAECRPVKARALLELRSAFDLDVLGVAVELRPASGVHEPRPDALGGGGDEELVAGEHGRLLAPIPLGEGDADALEAGCGRGGWGLLLTDGLAVHGCFLLDRTVVRFTWETCVVGRASGTRRCVSSLVPIENKRGVSLSAQTRTDACVLADERTCLGDRSRGVRRR